MRHRQTSRVSFNFFFFRHHLSPLIRAHLGMNFESFLRSFVREIFFYSNVVDELISRREEEGGDEEYFAASVSCGVSRSTTYEINQKKIFPRSGCANAKHSTTREW